MQPGLNLPLQALRGLWVRSPRGPPITGLLPVDLSRASAVRTQTWRARTSVTSMSLRGRAERSKR